VITLADAVEVVTNLGRFVSLSLPDQVEPRSVVVRDVTHDSRRVVPGAAFVALAGRHDDGTNFIAAAVDAGASVIVTEHHVDVAVPVLVVLSARSTMGFLAAAVHGNPARRLQLIAVTGTNGKTTTTQLCASMAEQLGRRTATIGTLSGARTTPESTDLQRQLGQFVRDGVELVALEATSIGMVEHRLAGLTVDVAVFLNLGRDHLDYHGTVEEYFAAKARLFTPEHARCAVVGVDDTYGRLLCDAAVLPTTSWSMSDADDLQLLAAGATFTWHGHAVDFPLAGEHNVANALAAAAALRQLVDDDAAIARAMTSVSDVPGRFEQVRVGQDYVVVVDYAHTPDAVGAVLVAAQTLAGPHRVICVVGCGGDRDPTKRPVMARMATERADVVVLTSDNPRSEDPAAIMDDMRAGLNDDPGAPIDRFTTSVGVEVIVELDRRAAIGLALSQAERGDVVVIAGKGHETTQEFRDHTEPFDDRVVAREWLEAHR
jgi:UDP-N-acetylmuramoyl-L-alanyl-D-glutamate--2,6-diaminopimelate ligase